MPRNPRANPLALAVLVLALRAADAPLRGRPDAAGPGQAREHPAQLRVALQRGRGARDARPDPRPARRSARAAAPSARSTRSPSAGTRELIDWLSELVATPVKEYLQFEAALSLLAGPAPRRGARPAPAQRADSARGPARAAPRPAQDAAGGWACPRLFALEGEYELVAARAPSSTSCSDLIADIDKGELDGLDEWRSWYEPGADRPADHQPRRAARPVAAPSPTPDRCPTPPCANRSPSPTSATRRAGRTRGRSEL